MKNLIVLFGILVSLLSFLSETSNAQWILSSNGITGSSNITSLSTSGSNIFAGTLNEGVYKSSDNGSSWLASNNGLANSAVYALATSASHIFAGTLGGVFRSANNGADWSLANSGISGIIANFAVAGSSIYAAGGSVYVSSNAGTNWTRLTDGLPVGGATCVVVSGSSSSIFAGHDNFNTGNVYKSTDGGSNWFSSSNGLSSSSIRCFAISGTTIFAGTTTGVYISTNDGISWIPANEGLPTGGGRYVNNLYSYGGNVFVGTNPPGGLYMTTNNGANWINKNLGFTGPQYVYSVVFANNYLFSAKYHSVWRRQYSEAIGIHNISTEIPNEYSLGQNYPNPFNPSTVIEFDVPVVGSIRLTVYDAKGSLVRDFNYEVSKAGKHRLEFEAGSLSSGVYYYKLNAHDFTSVKKMLLIK